jgi:hypothetical protein
MFVILKPLLEYNSTLSSEETVFIMFCLKRNAGSLAGGMSIVSLLSIEITAAIVGLSAADSCTHRSPICMNLKIFL